ncbi:L-threonate dehydrogenase [Erwinia amylovora]|uniref:L-threonate dehydrogenase n=1 Tax=Erwinia amylovora TaxID=552 RepID=UPI0014446EE0|nr:L-threonate dehydrogenase [Erwinia amylovora]
MSKATSLYACAIGPGSVAMGAAQSVFNAGLQIWGVELHQQALQTQRDSGEQGADTRADTVATDPYAVLRLMVNAAQVKQILFAESGHAARLTSGTAVMVSAILSSQDAQHIEQQLTAHQLIVTDDPVSGRAVKAAKGEMTLMASGSDRAFAQLQPMLAAVASKVYRIGSETGQGATVKMIHPLPAGVHIAAGAEATALAARAGIPLATLFEGVITAAGNAWMFENRTRHVVDGDGSPTSAVDIFVKDPGLMINTARERRFPPPLASTALNISTSASNAGCGREDDSAAIKIFSGISLPTQPESE